MNVDVLTGSGERMIEGNCVFFFLSNESNLSMDMVNDEKQVDIQEKNCRKSGME
jgi:hypothetical protein